MKPDEIEVGKKYKHKHTDGKTYFAIVKSISGKAVRIKLENIVNKDDDPGDSIDALGTLPAFDVSADKLEEM
jgi:hypothetical protein